jgi:hypothetical protein
MKNAKSYEKSNTLHSSLYFYAFLLHQQCLFASFPLNYLFGEQMFEWKKF